MAAYGSVVSLLNLMDLVHQHQLHRRQLLFSDEQIQALRRTTHFLQNFLERFSHGGAATTNQTQISLETQIATTALAVRERINFHMLKQVHSACTGQTSVGLCHLRRMIAKMDSIKAKVMKFQEEEETTTQSQPSFVVQTSAATPSGDTAAILGEQVVQIMDKLTRQQSSRLVLPIVGMGGIGKTTLARAVYGNRLVVEHFHYRIWITVSQQYSVKDILLRAVNDINANDKCDSSESEGQLAERLHKSLWGRRYLVVMDDIWSTEAWEQINRYLPKSKKGEAILITSRLSNMGDYFGSCAFKMQFLNVDESWNLFCGKAFGSQAGCLPEFEKIGRRIVRKCRGLPLSIVVIGGLLAKSPRTQEYWESVEKDWNSILSSENDDQCLNTLSLSYYYLPVHLKPCFLHMGLFKEDAVIGVVDLIRLWVAEGFLKPTAEKPMEEVGRDYLRDLVDRNLILKIGSRKCSIHDLLREVSLKIGQKEKFICVTSMIPRCIANRILEVQGQPNCILNLIKCFGGHESNHILNPFLYDLRYAPLVNEELWPLSGSIINELWRLSGSIITYSSELFRYRLLSFPNLGFCIPSIKCEETLHVLYKFWNVQSLSLIDSVVKNIDIWKMPQIRRISNSASSFCIPEPPVSPTDELPLENLQILATVENFRCTEQVLKRIPNLRVLVIECGDPCPINIGKLKIEDPGYYCLHNIGRFSKLEAFSFTLVNRKAPKEYNLTFPSSLKELKLTGCKVEGEVLKLIGELPNLEFLYFRYCDFEEYEWNIVEAGFRSLKCLKLEWCRLTHWTVESSQCFPALEALFLSYSEELSEILSEIPNGIGDIPTLNLIALKWCRASLAVSGLKIVEEQLSQGNEDLQVKACFDSDDEKEINSFWEMVGSEAVERNYPSFQILDRWDEWEANYEEEIKVWPEDSILIFIH